MRNKYSNKHSKVKNPNWWEADQLAIYKRSREVGLGTTENNISLRSKWDLNPGPTDFKSGALTIHLRRPWTSAFFRLASGTVGFSPRLKNSGHVITFLRRGGLQNTDHVMPFWPFKVDSLSHVIPAFVKVQRKERCPLYNLQSKQVKRFSHEWINNFIIANLISGIT